MVDLKDAGRRLAATRVGPTPPVDALRARRAKRSRRRRIAAAGSITVAAATLAVMVSALVSSGGSGTQQVVTSPTSPTPAALPGYHIVAGSTPYDYQRIRLWLPPRWTASSQTYCQSGEDVVYFKGYSGPGGPQCANGSYPGQHHSEILVSTWTGKTPPIAARTTINGIPVWVTHGTSKTIVVVQMTWYVPSLDTALIIVGPAASPVAATLEPSALQDLVTQNLPIPIPSGWRTVTYGGFQADIPADWPTLPVMIANAQSPSGRNVNPNLGWCALPLFHTPAVYLGPGPPNACPGVTQDALSTTNDGLWLQPAAPAGNAFTTAPQRAVDIGNTQVFITAGTGDTANIKLDAQGHRIDAVIGLGENPAIAAAILSSIHSIGAGTKVSPPPAPTVTNR